MLNYFGPLELAFVIVFSQLHLMEVGWLVVLRPRQVKYPPPPQDSISEFIPVFDSMYSKQFCPFRDFSISPNTEKL